MKKLLLILFALMPMMMQAQMVGTTSRTKKLMSTLAQSERLSNS